MEEYKVKILFRVCLLSAILVVSACGGSSSETPAPPPAPAPPPTPAPVDTDADGIADTDDTDDDNDGVLDTQDAFPLDASESSDFDNDGTGDNADNDDDNDGVNDAQDLFPLDANESADNDLDGIGNNADTDDDNDGTADVNDDFPFNAARTKPISPLFPTVNGNLILPNTPAANQLNWVIQQLAQNSTSSEEITNRFDSATLSQTNISQWQQFFDDLRTVIANGTVQDTYSITPTSISVLIGNANNPANGRFLSLTSKYGTGKIVSLGASPFPLNGGSTGAADMSLSYQGAADKLETLTEDLGLLVARIDQNNQCVPIFESSAQSVFATASIFKVWTMGAVAQAIQDGQLSREQTLPIVTDNLVLAGAINQEVGVQFRVDDLASLMLGISDNTATEHLFKLVGRDANEAMLDQLNHQNQDAMEPFLSMNEAFNLYFTVPEPDALAYISGDEESQRAYVNNVLTPAGPVVNPTRANLSVLVKGLWQASPNDVCNAMAGLRQYNDASEAFEVIDQAYGATTAIINLRNKWERVWFKGGSLDDGFGLRVLTFGWMLESDDRGTFAVIVMANNDSGGSARISQSAVMSVSSRLLDIVNETN